MITDQENVEVYASAIPDFDPNNYHDQLIMREQLPSSAGKRLLYEGFEEMTLEERRAELWDVFGQQARVIDAMTPDFPYHNDLEQDYFPR